MIRFPNVIVGAPSQKLRHKHNPYYNAFVNHIDKRTIPLIFYRLSFGFLHLNISASEQRSLAHSINLMNHLNFLMQDYSPTANFPTSG